MVNEIRIQNVAEWKSLPVSPLPLPGPVGCRRGSSVLVPAHATRVPVTATWYAQSPERTADRAQAEEQAVLEGTWKARGMIPRGRASGAGRSTGHTVGKTRPPWYQAFDTWGASWVRWLSGRASHCPALPPGHLWTVTAPPVRKGSQESCGKLNTGTDFCISPCLDIVLLSVCPYSKDSSNPINTYWYLLSMRFIMYIIMNPAFKKLPV